MKNAHTPAQLGYLIIYRMADVAVPYADLASLATASGFDTAYVPTPPKPRHAWEKATNIKRQKLVPPAGLVAEVQEKYGCEPFVFAETKVVSGNDDYGLLRHLVRSVVIKAADSKDKQLDMKSVAILKFDDTRTAVADKFVGQYSPDWDPAGATNGNIKALILRMKDEYERQLTMADGQDVRAGLRDHLDSLKATCLADGTYYIPETVPGAADKLAALQAYILGLAQWKITENTITCQVYRVADNGDAFSQANKNEIKAGAIDNFKSTLAQTLKDLTEPDGRGAQATAKRIREAGAAFLETKATIKLYQEALGDELQALDDMLRMCQSAMLAKADEE